MSKMVEAIFENGVLKPVTPLHIPEHKRVHLIIQEEAEKPSDILSLASKVYNGLSSSDIEDLEKIALDRSHFSRD
ncbi:MAG: antitoxin family protein [Nanoarchaeota archaeon]